MHGTTPAETRVIHLIKEKNEIYATLQYDENVVFSSKEKCLSFKAKLAASCGSLFRL